MACGTACSAGEATKGPTGGCRADETFNGVGAGPGCIVVGAG